MDEKSNPTNFLCEIDVLRVKLLFQLSYSEHFLENGEI